MTTVTSIYTYYGVPLLLFVRASSPLLSTHNHRLHWYGAPWKRNLSHGVQSRKRRSNALGNLGGHKSRLFVDLHRVVCMHIHPHQSTAYSPKNCASWLFPTRTTTTTIIVGTVPTLQNFLITAASHCCPPYCHHESVYDDNRAIVPTRRVLVYNTTQQQLSSATPESPLSKQQQQQPSPETIDWRRRYG